MDKTSIGDRMKGYEKVPQTKLTRRTPVLIRLDGKAFHTWTNHLRRYDSTMEESPYSQDMFTLMSNTALFLVENIQNARFAYVQSDEISILMNDWGKLNTDAWFDNKVQKMVSVSAAMASAVFNRDIPDSWIVPLAFFDSRVWNMPKEEVANYFIWRQQDATRNSINMLGQFYFSHKSLQNKNTSDVQDMLMMHHDVNWNDVPTWAKRGYCVTPNGLDDEIPIFTKDRDYIEQHLRADDEW